MEFLRNEVCKLRDHGPETAASSALILSLLKNVVEKLDSVHVSVQVAVDGTQTVTNETHNEFNSLTTLIESLKVSVESLRTTPNPEFSDIRLVCSKMQCAPISHKTAAPRNPPATT